jgi:hypothetical protein
MEVCISTFGAMVSVSRERQVETDRRLRAVLRGADLVHLDGTWCYERIAGDPPGDALATVRDADGWSALVLARGAGEQFGLTLTTFSPEIESSGYMGWIATTIKQRLGSGVLVICGYNPGRGGIFDYLGYPVEVSAPVRALLDELRTAPDDYLSLDLLVFNVLETSRASAISTDTWFEFRERDGVVEATYEGGSIVSGRMVGRRRDDLVRTAYAQLTTDGRQQTGTADMRVERAADGRVLLTEHYIWSDGKPGTNVFGSVERPGGS